jgi:dihydrolipoamide dehydrogenase
MNNYDLIIIGAGPGGYITAINAAQKGLKTALIEKNKPGGVCLNEGCLPTKTLIASADLLRKINKSSDYGLAGAENVKPDIEKIIKRKNKIVNANLKGITFLLKKNNVDYIQGTASFINKNSLSVTDENNQTVQSKNIIISTGTTFKYLKNIIPDDKYIINSTQALNIKKIPESIIILGGGYVGCEFAVIFNYLGSHVTIIEPLDNLLPTLDKEITKVLEREFKKNKINVLTKTLLTDYEISETGVKAKLNNGTEICAEQILTAVGRKPYMDKLGLDKIGIEYNENGIITDNDYKTNIKNIYAIGDVIGKLPLANVASAQGLSVVEHIINGHSQNLDYHHIPKCIFTIPEIGWTGYTEEECIDLKINYKVGKFHFRKLGKSHAIGEIEGIAKIIVDKDTENIIGGHIIGCDATELIHQISIAIKTNIKLDNFISIIRCHPTLSEILYETALDAKNN